MADRTEYYKTYRERPEVKERQRIHQFNWRKRHPESALALTRKNREKFRDAFNEKQRKKHRIWVKELNDYYVAQLIKRQTKFFFKTEDIPKDLINFQKQIIFINRKLKQKL